MTIKYQYFTKNVPQEIIDRIDKAPILGLDIETNLHLNPHDKDGRIRTVQISLSKEEIYIFDLFTLDSYEFLKTCFKGKLVLGQSLKFETKWLWKYNIDLSDCKWLFDTEIAARVIFNDQRESDWDDEDDSEVLNAKKLKYSLKALCQRHLGIELEKELQTSDWGADILTDDQLEYAAYDVYYLWDLREVFLPLIREYNLVEICKIEFKHIFVSASLEYNGIYLDKEEWESYIPEYEQKILEINKILYKTLPRIYKQTVFYGDEKVSINLKSSKQLLSRLQEYGIPTQSTSDKELSLFDRNEYPILGIIKEKRTLEKHLSTYLQSFGKYIHPNTNRIHYDIFQLAAKTGRISATNPPMLTIPRNDKWRQCFKGQNNRCFLDIDYSQIESRLVAVEANEEKMLDIFNNNLDIYAATAAIENDIPINDFLEYKETKPKYYKDLRQGAKSEVLGLCVLGNTKVITQSGIKEIKNIHTGDLVLTHKKRYKPVLETQQLQTTELITITTCTGKSITGTPDHMMLIYVPKYGNAWARLEDIKLGDYLVFHKTILHSNETQVYSNDQIQILGWWISEGYFSNYTLAITQSRNNELTFNKMKSVLADKYEWIVRDRDSNCVDFYCPASKRFTLFDIKEIDFNTRSFTKCFTNLIPLLTQEQKYILLGALWEGDGCISKKQNNNSVSIGYSSVSLQLIQDIQTVCHSLGINTTIYKYDRNCYTLHIVGSYSINEFFTKVPCIKIKDYVNTLRFMNTDEKVVSVEKTNITCDVYDITVQDDHSFVANELISHNCFGMGERRYKDYIDYVFGIKKSLYEIREQRNTFLNCTYPRLKSWHDECTKDYDKIDYLVNINNRRLWLFKPEYNVCINYRIQSLATDIIKDALNSVFFYLKYATDNLPLFDRNEIFQVAYVHDQGTWEGKKETLELYKEIIEDIMKFVGERHINYRVKIDADGHIGTNWAESH